MLGVLLTPSAPATAHCSKVMRVHAAVAGRHTRHGQLLPLEVYLEEGIPLVSEPVLVSGVCSAMARVFGKQQAAPGDVPGGGCAPGEGGALLRVFQRSSEHALPAQ